MTEELRDKEIPLSISEIAKNLDVSRFIVAKIIQDHEKGLRAWCPSGKQPKYYQSQIEFFQENPYELQAPDPEGYDFSILDGDGADAAAAAGTVSIQKQPGDPAPAGRGAYYYEVQRQGQTLDEWEQEPDQGKLKALYGSGLFKVLKRNSRSGHIVDAAEYSIGDAAARSDIENKIQELARLQDFTKGLSPAGQASDLMTNFLQIMMQQNQALLSTLAAMMTKNGNGNGNGNGHAAADPLDQLVKLEKVRKMFRGEDSAGDGDAGDGTMIQQIVGAVAKELIPRLMPQTGAAAPDQAFIPAGPSARVVAAPGPVLATPGAAAIPPGFPAAAPSAKQPIIRVIGGKG